MKTRYWILGGAAAAAGAAAYTIRKRKPRQTPENFVLELAAPGVPAEWATNTIQFVGTATLLIRCQGFTILTDPNFLHRGEQIHIGYGLHATRLTDPAIDFEQLPPIDFVVLSHLHEDHFDRLVEDRLPRDTPIVTAASAARALARKGFTRTFGLRPWDRVDVRKGESSLRVTAMPGQHGPLLVSALLPEVIGSMLEFRNEREGTIYRIYISGDTLVHSDLCEIPRRYPNIDLALLHLGGTRVLGLLVTMDAEQGIRALRILDPEHAIPIHYNDYNLFKDPLEHFMRAVESAGLQDKVSYLHHGETFAFEPLLLGPASPPL